MLCAASRSDKSWGSLDVLDAMDGVDVVTSVVALAAFCAGAHTENARSATSEPLADELVEHECSAESNAVLLALPDGERHGLMGIDRQRVDAALAAASLGT